MLYQGTKQSNDAEERAEKNSELVQEIADKKKTTTTSDTTKLNNKIKSAKNRLKEIKQVFAEIKKLEKSREVKQDITENLIDAISNVEYNLVEITGGK